jgi:plasmid stabilization system protein ParE
MAEVNFTAEAELCLREIFEYIAQDNPSAATRLLEGIVSKLDVLREFPEVGYRYERIADRHVRILLYGQYRIPYLVKPDRNIDVLGIYHGARLIERLLEDI